MAMEAVYHLQHRRIAIAVATSLLLVGLAGSCNTQAAESPTSEPSDFHQPGTYASGRTAASHASAATKKGFFYYNVRPGDSLGSIASTFGVPLPDLMRLNHMTPDSMLRAGSAIAVPNPFTAQMNALTSEVQRLHSELGISTSEAVAARAQADKLRTQNAELSGVNQQLALTTRSLRWWRGSALGAFAVIGLMLGITLLTLFEWLLLRRRFESLADLNESLRRLDLKYRNATAKAELRLQQLYGSRGGKLLRESDRVTLPEELEIERLDQQVRQALHGYLERLGLRGRSAKSRSRLRSPLDEGVGEPMEAPTARR